MSDYLKSIKELKSLVLTEEPCLKGIENLEGCETLDELLDSDYAVDSIIWFGDRFGFKRYLSPKVLDKIYQRLKEYESCTLILEYARGVEKLTIEQLSELEDMLIEFDNEGSYIIDFAFDIEGCDYDKLYEACKLLDGDIADRFRHEVIGEFINYYFSCSTNTVWTSFDFGYVKALSYRDAKKQAERILTRTLENVNGLLEPNGWRVEMEFDQITVEETDECF